MPPQHIPGLAAIIDRFDAVISDQWGVLHDGAKPYAGVVAALQALKARGVPVAVLSNSGRRAADNAAGLARVGIDPQLFSAVVTSGEAARELLLARSHPFLAGLGPRALYFARGGDRALLSGTGLVEAADVTDADFVIVAGSDAPRLDRADYRAALAPALARGLPLLCANPDFAGVQGDGQILGAGRIALDYQEAGGRVLMIGKPAPEMFTLALERLGGPDPARTLMIGDSPHHDIAGAKPLGIAALLVTCGLLARVEDVEAACAEAGAMPDFIAPALAW